MHGTRLLGGKGMMIDSQPRFAYMQSFRPIHKIFAAISSVYYLAHLGLRLSRRAIVWARVVIVVCWTHCVANWKRSSPASKELAGITDWNVSRYSVMYPGVIIGSSCEKPPPWLNEFQTVPGSASRAYLDTVRKTIARYCGFLRKKSWMESNSINLVLLPFESWALLSPSSLYALLSDLWIPHIFNPLIFPLIFSLIFARSWRAQSKMWSTLCFVDALCLSSRFCLNPLQASSSISGFSLSPLLTQHPGPRGQG
jgi:hypothetical protein